jgi:hypothetical protein
VTYREAPLGTRNQTRSRHENALPLIMTHGWPGSVIELLDTVGPLTERPETPRVHRLVFDVPGWPGHLPGQHVVVRLTAEDGYVAQRNYSLA